MKVYGHPMSGCTRKVLTVLAEKGHEAQFAMIDVTNGEQKKPEYLARHPFGVIPFFEDGDFNLYESRAIIRYLDQKLSGVSLTPSDPKSRAIMEQWISVEQSYFAGPVAKIAFQRVFQPLLGQPTDEKIVESAKVKVERTLDIVDKALAKQEYFSGWTFSLADVCWMPYVQFLFSARLEEVVTSRQHVNAWWKRVSTRPSWVKVSA